jgi:hypothetical protein
MELGECGDRRNDECGNDEDCGDDGDGSIAVKNEEIK